MDISDYSAKYAKEKTALNDLGNQVRDSYKKSVEGLEDTHKMKRAKETKNYRQNLAKLQEEQQEIYKASSSKTSDQLKQAKKEQVKRIESLRKSFEKIATNDREKFKLSIKSAKRGYQDSLQLQKEAQEEMAKGSSNGFQGKMRKIINYYNRELKDVQDASIDKMAEQNHITGIDKRKLVNVFHDDKYKVLKKNTEEMNDVSKKNNDLVDKLRNFGNDQLKHQKKNYERKLSRQSNLLLDNNEQMTSNFDKASKNLMEENKIAKKMSSEKTRKMTEELKTGFSDEKNRIVENFKSQSKRKSDHAGFIKNEKEQQSINHQRTVKSLQDEIGKVSANNSKHMNEASDKMKEVIKDVKNDLVRKNVRDVTNLEKGIQQQKINNKREKTATFDTYSAHVKDLNQRFEDSSFGDKRTQKKMLEVGRKEYAHSLAMMRNQNEKSLDGVKQDSSIDKTKFIEGHRKQSASLAREQRRNFQTNSSKSTQSFMSELSRRESQTLKMKEHYERKINMLEKKFMKELEDVRKFNADTMDKSKIESRKTLESKEYKYFNRFMDLKRDFDRKVSKIKRSNQQQMNKQIERYELKIDTLIREGKLNARKIKNESNQKLTAMERASKLLHAAQKTQYESKIEKLIERNIESRKTRDSRV